MLDLQKFELFKALKPEHLQKLHSFSRRIEYKKGSVVFYEKEQPTSLIFIEEGILKIYKTDMKNNEIIIHRFLPGSIVAEMAVLENIPYPATAEFESDGAVIAIDFEQFKKELLVIPEVSLMLYKSLSNKIKYLENVIALNIVLDSTSRVAKFIFDIKKEQFTLKKQEVAKQLHMTPETLSRTLKKLLDLGLIQKEKSSYCVVNRKGLLALFD